MGGAQVRTTMARVIAEACTADRRPNPGAVWLAPLADHRLESAPDTETRPSCPQARPGGEELRS